MDLKPTSWRNLRKTTYW